MIAWLEVHETLLWWLGFGSAAMFVITLAALPALVARIPADYFSRETRPTPRWAKLHPVLRLTLIVVKNAAGALFIVLGAAMLVLPGQGVLTILLGVTLLNFPGKFALERWLASRPAVYRALNWMRQRAGVAPIVLPETPGG